MPPGEAERTQQQKNQIQIVTAAPRVSQVPTVGPVLCPQNPHNDSPRFGYGPHFADEETVAQLREVN